MPDKKAVELANRTAGKDSDLKVYVQQGFINPKLGLVKATKKGLFAETDIKEGTVISKFSGSIIATSLTDQLDVPARMLDLKGLGYQMEAHPNYNKKWDKTVEKLKAGKMTYLCYNNRKYSKEKGGLA